MIITGDECMPTANDIYKADLSEYSYKIYEKFLHKVFMENNRKISKRHKTLLYCYLNRCVSTSQISIFFGDSKLNVKSNSMMMDRLFKSDYINLYTDTRKSSGKKLENIYVITSTGIKYCNGLISSLFPILLPDESFKYSGHEFSLKEVIEYLNVRCETKLPVYIEHYLGSRDVFAYLLSNPLTKGNYSFETEVGISESGIPVSLYSRSLLGFNMFSHPIRSDAVLTYPLPKENDNLRFFIELDTGTQRSSILTNKIQNYLDNYLNTNSFSPMSSLLFCLQTKVDDSRKELLNLKRGYGVRDYYYLVGLEFGFNMMASVLPNGGKIQTVGDALRYLDRLKKQGNLNATDELVYKYFEETTIIDGATPLEGLKNNYHVIQDVLASKKAEILEDLHRKAYLNRKDILHKSANSLTNMEEFFLKGFSLYTVPNFSMANTFPYLLPEMFGIRDKLSSVFSSMGLVNDNSLPGYRPFYKVDNDGFVLKNSYLFELERVHVIIENISDDLGGYYRIRHLLNQPSLPSSLMSSKIICLYDDNSFDMVRDMFVSTSIGKVLMARDGSRSIDNNFEVLFASYNTIKTSGSLFVFNDKGEAVYMN